MPFSDVTRLNRIPPPVRMRNEHWQRRFSRDFALIVKLREFSVEPDGAEKLVGGVCEAFQVPMPEFAFNRRRKVHNGMYETPRSQKVMMNGSEIVIAFEKKRVKAFSEVGVIRLGNPASVGTIAHEVAHHIVHHREHWQTPSHGRVFVAWNDRTVASIAGMLGL